MEYEDESTPTKNIQRWVGNSRAWLHSYLQRVESDAQIVAVIAIGSAVRNRSHRRSDFDLLVLYEKERPRFDAPLEVDIRAYEIGTIEVQLAAGHEILSWAVRFGVVLFDVRSVWQSIAEKWRGTLPLPLSQEALDRVQASLAKAREMIEFGDESAAEDLLLAGITQLVRARLIEKGIFPASRPELPDQLRASSPNDPLAQLLDDAMYGECQCSQTMKQLNRLHLGARFLSPTNSVSAHGA